ncbi:MAG TPA: DNA-binding protein [Bacteroides togonis]|nr:DNA-binding protein [Bacteroides togonis]
MSTIGTLKYRRYAAKSPQDPDGAAKWYARAVQDRTVEFEDFVTHISEHNSPYSRGVIHGVLIDMLACLKELVLDGKSVRLGDLGLFSVGISSKGAETAEAWTTSLITGVHLNVRNTKTWSNAELRKSARLTELTVYTAGGTLEEDTTPEPEPGGEDEEEGGSPL